MCMNQVSSSQQFKLGTRLSTAKMNGVRQNLEVLQSSEAVSRKSPAKMSPLISQYLSPMRGLKIEEYMKRK